MALLIFLLVIFQIKHFVADYPLQNEFMLGKFKPGWDFLVPLLTHCWVHGILTFCISMFFTKDINFSVMLFNLDFWLHFIMDRIKASPSLLGRFKSLDANCFTGVKMFAEGDFSSVGLGNISEVDKYEHIKWGKNRLKENKYFWWSLGLDQMVHHLTHYVIIYFIIKKITGEL